MAHSTFSIPVDFLNENSCCAINKNSKKAKMFCGVHLIIWDKAVTQHKYQLLFFPSLSHLQMTTKRLSDMLLKCLIICSKIFV
jgi:hypothetical protein